MQRDPSVLGQRIFWKLPRAGKRSRLAGRVPASRCYLALPKVTEISARDRHAFATRFATRLFVGLLTVRGEMLVVESPRERERGVERTGQVVPWDHSQSTRKHFTRGNAGHYVQLRCSTALVRPRPATLRALASPCCWRAPSSANHARHEA